MTATAKSGHNNQQQRSGQDPLDGRDEVRGTMADPAVANQGGESDEERRRREQEEAMERLLLQQEQEQELEERLQEEQENQHDQDQPVDNDNNNPPLPNDPAAPPIPYQPPHSSSPGFLRSLSYTQTSLFAALALLFYALRTRQQWYLALVYIRSSKAAYIILANALIATCVGVFRIVTKTFLGGLRLHEAEGVGDFFRWNVTETCLALTMFRSELTVSNGILFLILVLAKCLHWVADLREGHLRVTEESIVTATEGFWTGWPVLQWQHAKLWILLILLQVMDIFAVQWTGQDILTHGPSVSILFGFEAAILLVSAWNNLVLWHLHALDGWMHYLHEQSTPDQMVHRLIHPWKEHKATFTFAVEVQAQALKFLFYVIFFAIVLTYYGMPINLFRELYVSFQALKQRLVAFAKYRRLMASMNRFQSVTEEELEEAGNDCIICRDVMTVNDCKKLPGCGHIFHKSCLREWLVQQQSCPTCRGDITEMEKQAAAEAARRQAAEARAQQEGVQQPGEEGAVVPGEEDGGAVMDPAPPAPDAANAHPQAGTHTHPQADTHAHPQAGVTFRDMGAGETMAIPRSSTSTTNNAAAAATATSNKNETGNLPPTTTTTSTQKPRPTPEPAAPIVIEEQSPFPALYRVVKDEGADVWDEAHSVIARTVPFGVVVLCQALQWKQEVGFMMQLPDGWVHEDTVVRVRTLASLKTTTSKAQKKNQ